MKIRSALRLSDGNFRHHWISEGAYYLAEKRKFVPGMQLHDWFQAENVFVTLLISRYLQQAHEDGGISIKGLQRLARSIGIENFNELTQEDELVHAIQQAADNDPCYNFEPAKHCTVSEFCVWKAQCKQMIAKWHTVANK
jgi:hypothetical protein